MSRSQGPLSATGTSAHALDGEHVSAASSTTWNEVVPDGEAEEFREFAREVNAYQDGFARRGDGVPRRGFHVKTHAGVRAEFTVLADIPAEAKHGVFREAGTFPAWVRITNGFSARRSDIFPDLVGFVVKLTGVEGPKLLDGEQSAQTQDFLTLNQPYIPARTAAQLMIVSLSSANLLTAPFTLIRRLGLAHALQIILWTVRWSLRRIFLRSVATEDYYSCVPITLGPHLIKFKWQSRQKRPSSSGVGFWNANRLRAELQRRLENDDLASWFSSMPTRRPRPSRARSPGTNPARRSSSSPS
jgi:hypothetical protein